MNAARPSAHGFTLLELLVVMTLVALVAGVVAPAASRGLDAALQRGARQDALALLQSLPVRAQSAGVPQAWDADALSAALALPESWAWKLERPLRYGPNGVAEGGTVELQVGDGERLRWRVQPFSGEVASL